MNNFLSSFLRPIFRFTENHQVEDSGDNHIFYCSTIDSTVNNGDRDDSQHCGKSKDSFIGGARVNNLFRKLSLDFSNILQRSYLDDLNPNQIESLFLLQSRILKKAVLSKDIEESLVLLCQLTEKLLPDSLASVMLLDSSKSVLNILCAPSISQEDISLLNGLRIGLKASSCDNTVYRQKAQFFYDTSDDTPWGDLGEFATRFNILSCWSVPLYGNKKEIIGIFNLSSSQKCYPTRFYQTLLDVAAYLASLILEKQKLDQVLTHRARYDSLTDLPNQSYLSYHLQKEIAKVESEKSQLAVIFIDLDRFKYINDTYGHFLGDQVLITIASRLQKLKSEKLFISRLGGDEFILVMSFCDSSLYVTGLVELIMSLIARPLEIGNKTFYAMSSVGISLYPDHGQDEKTLLSKADTAMYEAKRKGKNQYCFYSSYMQDKVRHSLSIEQELQKAIDNEDFELYFQPKFNAKDLSLSGTEVLIRWKHPQKGLILPGHFIQVAEETGLIIPLGKWVLEKSLNQLKKWHQSVGKKISLSINLSNCQLKEKVIEQLLIVIEQNKVPSHFLELEITESYAMENIKKVTHLLQKIHEREIEIALDDFGLGYSSLGLLKHLPLNRLKIDKSLIHQITEHSREKAICQAVITLSKALGLKVTAEGIEKNQQMEIIRDLDCDELQGFYFSPPLEASSFEARYLNVMDI